MIDVTVMIFTLGALIFKLDELILGSSNYLTNFL
jgi:hypothetical protein